MKVIILDKIVKQLQGLRQADLFGRQEGNTVIISSLIEKDHFEKVGQFYQHLDNINREGFKDKLILTFNKGKLERVQNLTSQTQMSTEMLVVNYETDFNKRNEGIVNVSELKDKNVVVIGLGSGGSTIALDLLRSGVANQTWIDFDDISVSNLCRSDYDLCDVGRKKTEALLDRAFKINPCAEITIITENVLEMDGARLAEIIEKADLIIEATDSVKSKTLINGLAYHVKPVVYPSVYEFGKGGDILFTIQNVTPCFECVFGDILPQMKEVKRGDWDYSTGQAKPMPGLIADIKVIASRTVKIALAILMGDSKNSFFDKVIESQNSILFVGNEKDFWIFEESFQEVWAKTEINPECCCQTLQ